MKVTRLYSGEDGHSHFEDLSFDLKKAKVSLSAPKTIILSEVEAGHEYSWHNAERKQWVVTLSGEIQLEIGNGERRRFGPGDLLLAERHNWARPCDDGGKYATLALHVPSNGLIHEETQFRLER